MRYLFLLYALIGIIVNANAQTGYYFTDSTKNYGVFILDEGKAGNARYCSVRQYDWSIRRFSPNEVTEYGISSDKIYLSREIKGPIPIRVFMKKELDGKIKVLTYSTSNKNIYFLDTDTGLMKLERGKQLTLQLRELTAGCEASVRNAPFVRYTAGAISEYIDNYNHCSNKFLPHTRFGIFGFVENTLQRAGTWSEARVFDFKPQSVSSFGAFVDHPIYYTYWSIHPELQYSSHNYSNSAFFPSGAMDYIEQSKIIKIPVLLRFITSKGFIRPFVNAGPALGWAVDYKRTVLETRIDGDIINIESKDVEINHSLFPGISAGAGIEARISARFAFFAEARWNNFFPMRPMLGFTDVQYLTGIMF